MARDRLISRSDDPYRGMMRVFRIALVVSLLIHPLILLLLGVQLKLRNPHDVAARQRQDPSEIVTISSATRPSHRAVASREPLPHEAAVAHREAPKLVAHAPGPRPKQVEKPVPRPIQKPVPEPTIAPLPEPHDLAKIAPGTPVPEKARPKTVAYEKRPSTTQRDITPKHGKYSDDQIAQIESDLSKFTAADRGSHNPLSDVHDPSVAEAPKHYSINFQAVPGSLRPAEGVCDPIKTWHQDGYDYYYEACNVVEPDGTMTRKPVPWPVRYRPNDDPFDEYSGVRPGRYPLLVPLPGWHPDPQHTIDPDFVPYLRQQGYPI
jgi:hypothetical protein